MRGSNEMINLTTWTLSTLSLISYGNANILIFRRKSNLKGFFGIKQNAKPFPPWLQTIHLAKASICMIYKYILVKVFNHINKNVEPEVQFLKMTDWFITHCMLLVKHGLLQRDKIPHILDAWAHMESHHQISCYLLWSRFPKNICIPKSTETPSIIIDSYTEWTLLRLYKCSGAK